jgi:uncharacterized protein (TIGR02118 family)
MIKSVTFFKRKPGMTVDAFQAYWRTRHLDVVIKLPGIRRYVQSHTLPSIYARREPVYDGIAEIWTDDMDALRAMTKTPHYPLVKADEAEFIDGTTMGAFVVREHVIKDGPLAAIKSVAFVTRRPDLSIDAFQRHWRSIHGPIAAGIPMLSRYVQCHTLPETYVRRTPPYDGIAVTWFDSTASMRQSATTQEYVATRADESNFVAPGDMPIILTVEHLIVG